MARTRKSVLGENPFASGGDPSPSEATANGDKPRKRSSQGSRSKKPRAAAKKPSKAAKKGTAKSRTTKASKPASRSQAKRKEPARAQSEPAAGKSGLAARAEQAAAAGPKPTAGAEDAPRGTEPRQADPPTDPQADRHRIAEQVRALENEVERPTASKADPPGRPTPAMPQGLEPPGGEDGGMFETARGLLSSDYYLRQWGRLGMRNRSAEVDDFGHDRKYDGRMQPLLDVLYERYFRIETEGIENVPAQGRALIVANHGGTFPYDGVMLKTAVRREHPQARSVRWLTEDHLFYMPFVGSFLNRLGSVRACQENAERLLRHGRLVAVFPEGAKGTGRLYRNRHKLQRFGRGGFIRLCLRTQTPIIPCVIVGAEESMPLLFRIEYLANVLGIPYIPVTPTFPLLGPFGVLPAPTKWQLIFGEPMSFERYGPDAADDHVLVRRLTERVRATMQGMIEQAASSRRSPWFG